MAKSKFMLSRFEHVWWAICTMYCKNGFVDLVFHRQNHEWSHRSHNYEKSTRVFRTHLIWLCDFESGEHQTLGTHHSTFLCKIILTFLSKRHNRVPSKTIATRPSPFISSNIAITLLYSITRVEKNQSSRKTSFSTSSFTARRMWWSHYPFIKLLSNFRLRVVGTRKNQKRFTEI